MATQQDINFIRLVDAGLWAAASANAPASSTYAMSAQATNLLGLPDRATVTQGAQVLANIFTNSPLPGGVIFDDVSGSFATVTDDVSGTGAALIAN